MRYQLRSIGCFAAIALAAMVPASSSQAQGSPAMHWGSMELEASVNTCLGRAKKALYDAGLHDTQHTGWQWYGVKGSANVLVSCSNGSKGGSSYLVVVAASPDSRAA